MMIPVGGFIGTVQSMFDDGGAVMWRIAMLFQIIPALIHICLSVVVFSDIDLPT